MLILAFLVNFVTSENIEGYYELEEVFAAVPCIISSIMFDDSSQDYRL